MSALRVGLLVPSSNTVMERDVHMMLEREAVVMTSRMYLVDTTPEGEEQMLAEEAVPAARRVGTAQPDIVVFGCTSASSLHGLDYDESFRTGLAEVAGAPVVGVLDSAIRELSGAGRVALFTPYVAALTASIGESLSSAGIEVVRTKGLGIRRNIDIGLLPPEEVVNQVTSMNLDGADVVFCSCTNLRAVEARQGIIGRTGLPVVTSNQAVVARLRHQSVANAAAAGSSPPRPCL